MVISDDEEVPMSVKERARLLNSQPQGQRVELVQRSNRAPPVKETALTPEKTPVFRPNLVQFRANSEELLRATKSGVVDLAGKGKVGILEATDSIKGFIDRPRWSNGTVLNSKPREGTMMDFSFREEAEGIRESYFDDVPTEENTEVFSPLNGPKSAPKWKLPEFDRRAVRSNSWIIISTANKSSDRKTIV